MPNYATVSQVMEHKIAGEIPRKIKNYSPEEIAEHIEVAEAIIENHTNTIFYSKSETVYLNGTGNLSLFFYHVVNYPIISATSVKEVDPDGTVKYTYLATDYVVQPWYISVAYNEQLGAREFTVRQARWPKGLRNIQIVGTWGRSAVPSVVKTATILLTLESLIPGCTGLVSNNIVEREWEDLRLKYRGTSSESIPPQASVGYDYIDRLLAKYVLSPAIFITPDTHIPHPLSDYV